MNTDIWAMQWQGLLGSISVCAALQGGQFMFTNILLGFTQGGGKRQTAALFRGRLFFFAFLVVRLLKHLVSWLLVLSKRRVVVECIGDTFVQSLFLPVARYLKIHCVM